jgi:ribosomal protein S18 acetylase RimI-like enzyme
LTLREELTIEDVPYEKRKDLVPILEESFEGMYLWHSKKTLEKIEAVKVARYRGKNVGLAMLKMLNSHLGYVYYVAVSREYRGLGIGGLLLDNSLDYFISCGAVEVFAAVEEDNIESIELFKSRGFEHITFSELSKKMGRLKAATLWSKMLVVPGEVLLHKQISPQLI